MNKGFRKPKGKLLWMRNGNGTPPVFSGTLTEHYDETTWNAFPVWEDKLSARVFQANTGGQTSGTQNGLITAQTNGSIQGTGVLITDKPFSSWVDTTEYITIYAVLKNSSSASRTFLDFYGSDNSRWYWATSAGVVQYILFQNGAQSLLINTVSVSAGWQVWAIKLRNITGDGQSSLLINTGSIVNSAVNSSWVAMGIGNYKAATVNRLGADLLINQAWNPSWPTFAAGWGELRLYLEDHTEAQMQAINGTLMTKWGI